METVDLRNSLVRAARSALLLFAIAGIGLILSGCASGVQSLGQIELFGNIVEYVQIGSKGETGPKLTIVEGFTEHDGKVTKISEYSAAGNSLTGQILGGTGAAALAAGGQIGGQYLRRPNMTRVKTSVSTSVSSGDINSGSSSSSESGSSASNHNANVAVAGATANSNQTQDQVQVQGQGQNQEQSAEGGHGCPGNSCGQGPR